MNTIKFKALLDEQVNWPDYYVFKFITKSDNKHVLLSALSEHHIEEKESKNGKYTSVTSRKLLYSSDEVLSVYSQISEIEGIITL